MGSSYVQGMEKLFKGILKYRTHLKGRMVKQFEQVRDHPNPSAVFVTCVDSRLHPTVFTQVDVGDMFIVRNVGNVVPHSGCVDAGSPATEPAVLELGCVLNGIKHVVVCGHSDCKAMGLLHTAKNPNGWEQNVLEKSPLKSWMLKHGLKSLRAFEEIEKNKFQSPLILYSDESDETLEAFIDVEQKFDDADKLSQVHTLVQMENIASYKLIKSLIRDGKTKLHALWFDIHSGDVYYFSRLLKHFIVIKDDNYELLLKEIGSDESAAKEILNYARKHITNMPKTEGCEH